MSIRCSLVNNGGASEWVDQPFDCEQVPRQGELIVMKRPHQWGSVLKVDKVVHRSGEPPALHVAFHCGEQYL